MFRIHLKERPQPPIAMRLLALDEQKCVSALLDHFFNNGLIMIETCSGLLSTPMTQSEIDQLCQVTLDGCAQSSRCCDHVPMERNTSDGQDSSRLSEQRSAGIPDNAVLMIGGFGGSGAPIELIHALIDRYKATGSPANIDGHQQQRGQWQELASPQ